MERDPFLQEEESIDLKALAFKFLRYWYLFPLGLVISIFTAWWINEYTTPEYTVSASILIREEKSADPMSLIGENPFLKQDKIEDEIGLMKSFQVAYRTVNELDFTVSYFKDEKFESIELYKNSPFTVILDTLHDQPVGVKINARFLDDENIIVSAESENVHVYNFARRHMVNIMDEYILEDTLSPGEYHTSAQARFALVPGSIDEKIKKENYSFVFHTPRQLARRYQQFDVEQQNNSSILKLSFRGTNVMKSVDFLNTLTNIYLQKGIERKNKVALNALIFIESQLMEVADSLGVSEEEMQDFRLASNVINLDFQAQRFYSKLENLQAKKGEILMKLKYFDYLKKYLSQNNPVDELVTPAAIDVEDPLLNKLLIDLTTVYNERTEATLNTKKANPYVESIDQRIENLKKSIISNVDNIIDQTRINLDETERQMNLVNSEITNLPAKQRELLGIERKFKLNDELYTFLLTRRAEMEIARASNIPVNE
ncbi:MAG: GumC family protein, partial [Bacteroidota bacterium]